VRSCGLTIRYDSGYLTCSKKLTDSQLSLPHRINRKLKCETKNKMMSVISPVRSRLVELEQNSSCAVALSCVTLVRRYLSLRSCLRSCGQVLGTPGLNYTSTFIVVVNGSNCFSDSSET